MSLDDQDPYCYPETNILKNLRDFRDRSSLDRFEADAVAADSIALKLDPLKGPFDTKRLQATHRRLFGRVYAWAGELRANTGTMKKQRASGYVVMYGLAAHIPMALENTFAELEKENELKELALENFAKRLAYFYSELDAIHAFREGNSRTLRVFTADLATAAGYRLAWSQLGYSDAERESLYAARDKAVMRGDCSELEAKIATILSKHS